MVRAGTGKSTLLQKIVKETCQSESDLSGSLLINGFKQTKKKRHLYLINVDGKDTSVYKKNFPDVHSIEFEDLENTKKKSCIVVEDIIHMSKKDESKLRTAINYQMHHRSQKIICATHSIFKTNLFSILLFFHYIIITSAAANVPTLRNLFRYFKIDPKQEQIWIEKFKHLGNGKHGIYFYFNCSKMTFNISKKMLFRHNTCLGTLGETDDALNIVNSIAPSTRLLNLESKFSLIVSNTSFKNEANSIFSIIINCLPTHALREADLTVIFLDKKSEQKKLISLVDYIFILLSSKTKISAPLLTLHKYVKSICNIPKSLIRNSKLL
jgi:hypothetical protein